MCAAFANRLGRFWKIAQEQAYVTFQTGICYINIKLTDSALHIGITSLQAT